MVQFLGPAGRRDFPLSEHSPEATRLRDVHKPDLFWGRRSRFQHRPMLFLATKTFHYCHFPRVGDAYRQLFHNIMTGD
ncbi:unnamed protein product [Tuber melanosporum]|uniref:(Perigord truffle) hypothetical protein n=1 Tax=Tuber melanosporum (strain Mel28) TaxID=656061 RepID=D5G9C0_TUBMM|nr:uncharacterized protein GSTUM_00003309001 [Tuber melanosporum]CAZ81113.1 unnamed protein product [Tuber melanosporum]